jgi:putative heme-binding domain-containing protein
MHKIRTIILALSILSLFTSGCRNASNERTNNSDSLYTGTKFNEHIRSTEARTPADEQKGFKLPEGFEINLFASEPDIGKPINLTFDAKGRMWVTQSFEYPFAAKGKGRDRVTILEDTNGDGKADKFTNFNDTLNIPIGVLPTVDGAMVYSIPNVYKFKDENHDGKPETSKKVMGPFEAKDTHGMVNNFAWGFDGWIHACHGFSNRSTVAAADGDSVHLVSGNTIRFRPDGSRVELTTEGRINPFGLAFDEMGYLYSTDCHTSPLYQLIRGGEYTQWGKEEKIGFAPDMKPLEDEATALAGIAYYGDVLYPEEYRSNLYIGDAVASRVYRNSISWKQSTPVGKKEEDFILSADPWFRPVDVKMGPDGALYIADFYNSIIGHYEVPLDHPKRDRIRGRIWRVTYKGKVNKNTDWTAADVQSLLNAFKQANLSVRFAATNQLADRVGPAAVEPVRQMLANANTAGNEYVHALWVLQRLNALTEDMIKSSAAHQQELVRIHAMRAICEQNDTAAALYNIIETSLKDDNPHVRRAAVEALGRYTNMQTVERLIAFRKSIPADDSHLIYTTRIKLRDLLRNESLMQEVISRQWSNEDAAVLATVMVGVETQPAGMFLNNYVKNHDVAEADLPRTLKHVVRFVPAAEVSRVISMARAKAAKDEKNEFIIFRNVRDGLERRGAAEPADIRNWGKALATRLINKYDKKGARATDENREEVFFATEAAGNYKVAESQNVLRDILKDTAVENYIRSSALRSLLKINPQANASYAVQTIQDTTSSPDFRRDLVNVLSEFPGGAVNNTLLSIKNAPPDLQQSIVVGLAGSPQGRKLLFDKVRSGEMQARTLAEPRVEERLMMNISPAEKKVYQQLTANLDKVDQEKESAIRNRIADYNNLLNKPDPASGEVVFQKNCSPCHSIKGKGGAIGPQLDGVGRWGAEPLIEKILDPNRNISENFRSYTVKLKDGKIRSGLYRRDEGQVVIFADAAGQEFSISKQDIVERTASNFTLMPDHFRNTIPVEEFHALISFLLSQK